MIEKRAMATATPTCGIGCFYGYETFRVTDQFYRGEFRCLQNGVSCMLLRLVGAQYNFSSPIALFVGVVIAAPLN